MQTFSTLTLFFALSTAVPHALNHFRLHERALQADALALKPLVERDLTVKTHLVERQEGACSDSSSCPEGMCCSQYGFCGAGPQYCGGSSANSFGPPSGQGGAPGGYPHQGPPGGFGPPPGSPQGPPQGPPSAMPSGGVPPSPPPSPSAPAPMPSGSVPSQPSGFPSQPSSPSEPSNVPSAPSNAPSQPSAPPTAPSGGPAPSIPAPQPSGSAPAAPSVPAQPSGTAAPAPSSAPGGGGGLGNVYKFYTGDGSPTAGWPAQTEWMDFEGLWSANLPTISISCTQFGEKNNSPQESDDMKSAIQSVGASSGVDPRVILAVVMQESKGCVRVITTDNGVVNPGLMQSHDGSGSCNSGGDGAPGLDPCPASEITQMITDGSTKTASGAGLSAVLPQCTATDIAQKYYQAATIYNSGSLPQNLDDNTATACYASDIANRLTGWTTAQTQCNL